MHADRMPIVWECAVRTRRLWISQCRRTPLRTGFSLDRDAWALLSSDFVALVSPISQLLTVKVLNKESAWFPSFKPGNLASEALKSEGTTFC